MIEISNFIGYAENHRNLEFHTRSDSKLKYSKNLESQGPLWEYRDIKISYKRNSFGHRSKEYSSLDLDNYILCTGCSLSEGIGLPVEKRYSDVLANKLECDIYNMGIGGSGNDMIFYNLITWFNTVPKKPKLVVIGWTSENRFLTKTKRQINLYNTSVITGEQFLSMGDQLKYFKSKSDLLKILIRKIITVPIIEIPWFSDTTENTDSLHVVPLPNKLQVDYARDLVHPGIKTNQNIASLIFDYIRSKNLM